MGDEPVEDSPIAFVADHARRYAASGGEEGGETNGVPVLLLTVRGRRSGALRRTPVAFHRDGDAHVVVAAARGARRHPQWYLNLVEDPAVEVQLGRERFPATATVAEGAERERLWSWLTEAFSPYAEYQEKAGRELPVVVLRRRSAEGPSVSG